MPVIERDSREPIDAFRHAGRADLVADYATRSERRHHTRRRHRHLPHGRGQ
ncbi:hypothetical protein ACWCQJ_33330 [Streptomyces olivaceus]